MAPPHDRVAVFLPLAVASGIIFCTVVVHAFALIAIIHYVRHERERGRAGTGFWRDVTIAAGTVLVAPAAYFG